MPPVKPNRKRYQFKTAYSQADLKKLIEMSRKVKEGEEQKRIRKELNEAELDVEEGKKKERERKRDLQMAQEYLGTDALETAGADYRLYERMLKLAETHPKEFIKLQRLDIMKGMMKQLKQYQKQKEQDMANQNPYYVAPPMGEELLQAYQDQLIPFGLPFLPSTQSTVTQLPPTTTSLTPITTSLTPSSHSPFGTWASTTPEPRLLTFTHPESPERPLSNPVYTGELPQSHFLEIPKMSEISLGSAFENPPPPLRDPHAPPEPIMFTLDPLQPAAASHAPPIEHQIIQVPGMPPATAPPILAKPLVQMALRPDRLEGQQIMEEIAKIRGVKFDPKTGRMEKATRHTPTEETVSRSPTLQNVIIRELKRDPSLTGDQISEILKKNGINGFYIPKKAWTQIKTKMYDRLNEPPPAPVVPVAPVAPASSTAPSLIDGMGGFGRNTKIMPLKGKFEDNLLASVVKRFNILMGELKAGNHSKEIKNELYDIIDFLLRNKRLTKPQHKKIVLAMRLNELH